MAMKKRKHSIIWIILILVFILIFTLIIRNKFHLKIPSDLNNENKSDTTDVIKGGNKNNTSNNENTTDTTDAIKGGNKNNTSNNENKTDTTDAIKGGNKNNTSNNENKTENPNNNNEDNYPIDTNNTDKINPDTPSFIITPENTTKEDVVVTINYSSDSVKKEYKIDGGNWQIYTRLITIKSNSIVYARGTDLSENESNISSININNIDKISPKTPIISENTNESTSQLKVISVIYPIDAKIKQYKIDESNWQPYEDNLNMNFNSIIYAKATDEAGNESVISLYQVIFEPTQLETITPEEPIEMLGTFDYITNAGANAVWDAINIDKTVPEGTSISTLLATSNDGVTYSSFSSSINNIQSSRYLKIRINTSSQDSTLRATVKGINVLYHFKEEIINNIKPIAVISLNQDINIKTSTSLSWNSDYSYDINQVPIIDEEWLNKYDNYSNPGQYIVKLRVKNSLGIWSEWVQKTIDVEAPLNHKPTVVIIMNPENNITTDTAISWSYLATDIDSDNIVEAMWLNNKTKYLSQGYYQVQLKVKDSRGAWSSWMSKTFYVIDKKLDNPSIVISPTNSTNGSVEAIINYAQTTSNNLYSFDEVNWLKYTGKLTIIENKTIYAKGIKDNNEESEIISLTINNIDKIKPQEPVISGNFTIPVGSGGLNISINYSGDSYSKLYSTDNGELWKNYTGVFNVKTNGEILAKGIDIAGNESEVKQIIISNIRDVLEPTYEINPDVTVNSNVTLTINYNNLPGKKYKIGNGVWQDYIDPITIVTNSVIYTKGISDENVESDVITITINNIDKTGPANANFSVNTSLPTNNNVTLNINYPNDAIVKEYKIDEGEWLTYTGLLTITENCIVYTRSYDALENESNISSINISNIDRVSPDVPSISVDTTAPLVEKVNVNITYSSNSNQKKYKIDNGNWTTYTGFINITKNCTVYAKGIDDAGNESNMVEYAINNINNVLKPNISVNNTNVTNQDVIVTIDYSDMLYKKYSFDGINWLDYTGILTINANTTVYAKSINENDIQSSIQSIVINNIDKESPEAPIITKNPDYETTGNVMVNISYSDDSSYRKYSYDNITWYGYVNSININSNKIIYAKAIDNVGNQSEVVSITIDNIVIVLSPIININPITKTNQDVTVTIDYQGIINKKYKIGNGEWIEYVNPITLTENTSVYAKGINNEGFESIIKSYTINNIDKTAPIKAWFNTNPSIPTNGNVTVTISYPGDAINRQYKIDDNYWQLYTGIISLSDNGTIYAKSTDNVGNESDVNSMIIANIDKTKPYSPTLSQDITDVTENNVTITAIYTSDSSQKKYKINDGLWQNYTGVISLNTNATVYAKGIDDAGNESSISSINVTNINHKPIAVITMSPNENITTSTIIIWDYINSTDSDGDKIVAYEWENNQENYVTAGEKTSRLRVKDERGLWSDWVTKTFTVQLDWLLISETAYIQDATEEVNWLSVNIIEILPADTRIKYYYSTSNNGTTWGSETENIAQVSDARYIRVRISYQRLATSSNTPTLSSITINCDRQIFTYVPETMPGKPITFDIGDNQNASDIEVIFGKANKEMYLSQYRIILVPLENTNTFNIYEANTITSDKYQEVSLGTTSNIQLRADLKDITGAGIINNKQYKIYVLAVGNSELVKNQLSEGSDDFAITPKPSNPVLIANITAPTNTDVIVTINYSPTASVKQYKIGEAGIWNSYTGNITLTVNNTIYAKCANSEGIESDMSSINITNIDKVIPSSPGISLSTNAKTNQDVIGTINFSSDSVERLYRINNGEWIVAMSSATQLTMTDNGSIEAKNKDSAGNWSNVTLLNVTNIDRISPVQPTMAVSPTAPTTGMVTLTITYSGDSSVKQYSYDQVTWSNYTAALSLTTNKTVYAKGIDAAGNASTVASLTVANIVVAGPGSPTVYDTPVNGDASDVEVRFTSPSNEDNISEYRVYAVKSPNVLTVDQAILNSNYQIDVKTGPSKLHRVYLTNTFKDVDGELLSASNTYIFYVLSIANEGYTSVLSTPSAGMKLIVSYAVNFDDVNDVTHQDDTKTEILNGKLTLKGVVGGSYTNNLIPPMSSNTAPSGIANASVYATDAWRAFGGYAYWNTYYMYNSPPGSDSRWLSYEFTEPKKIQKYIIKHDSGINFNNQNSARTFSFQGSNDGVNWDTLDQRTDVKNTDWYNAPSYAISYTFDNSNYYTKYRLHITIANYATGAYIDNLSMMEKAMGYSNLAAGYYVLVNPINVSNWTTITKILSNITTSAGTYFKYLFSFDNGTTWVRWEGSSWQNSVLTSINGYATATSPTTTANWALTGGFVAGTTQNIRIAIGLKTLYENATPIMDKLSLLHQE